MSPTDMLTGQTVRREFRLPDLGEGLAEAEIVQWLVAPGDTVEINQPLVEVETAKAQVEIPSPFAGVVDALHGAEGDLLTVGAPLLTIAAPGAAPASAAAEEPPPAPVVGRPPAEPAPGEVPRRRPRRGPPAPAGAPAARTAPRPAGMAGAPAAAPGAPPGRTRVLAAPPVRRLARDLGVDLAGISPTGPGGTIARADVTAAARPTAAAPGAPAPAPAAQAVTPGQRIPVRGVAREMAVAMERSAFTVPQATVARDIDVTALLALLERWRARSALAGSPAAPRVTPLAFITRAVVAAVGRHPLANARWVANPDGSCEIEVYGEVNLGVAVASERGLVVPVIPGAQRLTLAGLAGALAELVATARAGRTPPARMRGGTVTVSNVGVLGVDRAVGLVQQGQTALVVLGAIREIPAVREGTVQVRTAMTVSVSFDHRILDGAGAAAFLAEIAAVLTEPELLLLAG